jgi:hypothetical protein
LHGIHEGRLRVTGNAPDALTWEVGCRRDGPPLQVYESFSIAAPTPAMTRQVQHI